MPAYKQIHRRRGEKAQTFILFVLLLVLLLLFIGLGIDVGFAYVTRANLSKAVDAAALAGMRNYSTGTLTASALAKSTFAINYGRPGRDTAAVVPTITFAPDANNNQTLSIKATATINTFFIRVLPTWKTLSVSSSALTTRNNLIMSLVLDRSGSMLNNGGSTALPPAVDNFIQLFDDNNDHVASVSFASAASTDVAMSQPFKTSVANAANALSFGNYTCSDEGLTNAVVQNNTITILPGQNTIKVIVFFTDGMCNSFNYNFACGSRDIIYQGPTLVDPATGNSANSGCTIPSSINSINPQTGVVSLNTVNTSSCDALHIEAQNRAERIAYLARAAGNTIYCIGLGDPTKPGECNGDFPVLNPAFLMNVANTTNSATYNASQPVGDYVVATTAAQLDQVFQEIAARILLRISQ